MKLKPKSFFSALAERPERLLAAGFLLLILIGAVLLSLPFASQDGESIGWFSALFTSTSAVCVTGLVAVDTGTSFSLFGQIVLLLLIQVGGLGFMIFATRMMVLLGHRITLRERKLLQESLNASSLSGLITLSRTYGLLALGIELLGAVLLSFRFVPALGWAKGLWYAVFHSVSAFCNAGFDLLGGFQSLTAYQRDPLVLLTVSLMIILGGLGFSVIIETAQYLRDGRGEKGLTLSLHARIVLVMTGGLLLLGTLFYLGAEWSNPGTLGEGGFFEKLLNAFFQSVTMRTAGFNSVDLGAMRDGSKLLSCLLMLVGASPASTGGGLKTTTVAAVALLVLSVVRSEEDVNLSGRRLARELTHRALAVMTISLSMLALGTLLITLFEDGRFALADILMETSSAAATVGVSSLGTPKLTTASRVVLLPMMFLGRVGPLTLAMALSKKQDNIKKRIKYPEENIMIG